MNIKWRITLWIIATTLGVAIIWAVATHQAEVAKYLAIAIVGVGVKLAESEEQKDS